MSHTALYRTYRPSTFKDIKGQEHIVKTFKNALKKDHVSHAYMFLGPRGVGKTTIARIISKTINCEKYPTDVACEKCASCLAINTQTATDIIEIDAASNTGVDDMKSVLDNVHLMPSLCKNKVYIIDEVHMLSKHAFNALLKTLEEPPSHVKFILATTEPEQIPATIHSRCQKFEFRGIGLDEINERLIEVCNAENVKYDEKALKIITQQVDGGMRDALSLLDQVISYSDKKITIEDVNDITGSIAQEHVLEIISCFNNNDCNKALQLLDELVSFGKEIPKISNTIIHTLRDMLVYKNIERKDVNNELFHTDDFKNVAKTTLNDNLFLYIDYISKAISSMRHTLDKKTFLELAFIKITTVNKDIHNNDVILVEKVIEKPNIVIEVADMEDEVEEVTKPIATPTKTYDINIVENVFKNYSKELKAELINKFNNLETTLVPEMFDTIELLKECNIVTCSNDTIILATKSPFTCNNLMKTSTSKEVKSIFKKLFSKIYNYLVLPIEIWDSITLEYRSKFKSGDTSIKLSPIIHDYLVDEIEEESDNELIKYATKIIGKEKIRVIDKEK